MLVGRLKLPDQLKAVQSNRIIRASRDARLMPAIRTSVAARVGSGTHPATKTSAVIPIYVILMLLCMRASYEAFLFFYPLESTIRAFKGIEKSVRSRSDQGLLAYVQGMVKAGVGP